MADVTSPETPTRRKKSRPRLHAYAAPRPVISSRTWEEGDYLSDTNEFSIVYEELTVEDPETLLCVTITRVALRDWEPSVGDPFQSNVSIVVDRAGGQPLYEYTGGIESPPSEMRFLPPDYVFIPKLIELMAFAVAEAQQRGLLRPPDSMAESLRVLEEAER